MGSLISHIVFTPPKKQPEQDLELEADPTLTTPHRSEIQVKVIQNNEAKFYMLVSHGNSEDINSISGWGKNLCNYLNVNVVLYEYTGYGANQSNNRCSEEYCYGDIDTVYNHMINFLKISPDKIIIYGRGLGTGPSVYLASQKKAAGLILVSPFLSIYRIILNFRWTLPGDMFPNIDRIKNVECPVCIIHSIKDEVIPFYHAKELYKTAKIKYDPLYIDGTSHNTVDIYTYDAFDHIAKFLQTLDPKYKSHENDDSNIIEITK